MKQLLLILISLLTIASCTNSQTARKQIQLSENWKFKAIDDSIWLDAKVPGVIHLDLLDNKIISNPFDSTNEKLLQWIGKKDGGG